MTYLIIIFAIIFLILAKIRLEWAILLTLIALPSYLIRFQVFSIPFTLLELMILISFLVWFFKERKNIWHRLRHRKKRTMYPFYIEIILLLIISYISMAIAGFDNSAMGIWKAYFLEPIILFILLMNNFRGRDGIRKIIFALSISAFLVSVTAIFQQITGLYIYNEFWANIETRRVVSFFGYPNAIGLYLAPIILLMVGSLKHKFKNFNRIKKVFLITTIILSILSIYFAKSEGALIAIACSLILFIFLYSKKARIVSIVLIVILGSIIALNANLKKEVVRKLTLMDKSGQIKQAQWNETWEMLNDGNIILGSGLANYQEAITPYHQEGVFVKNDDPDFQKKVTTSAAYRKQVWQPVEVYLYPHNIFLNFWTELGLFGLILFLWIILKYFLIGFKVLNTRDNKYLTLGLIGAMMTIFIHGLVDVPYFKNDLSIIFWILIALLGMLDLKKKNI